MSRPKRWIFKTKFGERKFIVSYSGYKLLSFIHICNGLNQTYRQISNKLGIKRDNLKNACRELLQKYLIDKDKNITPDGLKVLELLKEKVEQKELELKISNEIVHHTKELVDIKAAPRWFENSLQSKEYASHAITLSIDLEGSVVETGGITIYQTGKYNKPLLFLLSLISHYHDWSSRGSGILDDLRNGYVKISLEGFKEIYELSHPLCNPQKDKNARKLLNLSNMAESRSGWAEFIIKNKAVELIGLAMEEEFMIKSLCLRLKEGDPTQAFMYEVCKNLDLVTSDSEKSMKKYNGFQIRADRLPFIFDQTRTFIIPYKRDKILNLIERHKRNTKGSHKYSSIGIKVNDIIFEILRDQNKWMTSREIWQNVIPKVKVSDSLIFQSLEKLCRESKIDKQTIRGRGLNWQINQWKINSHQPT